MKRRIGQWLLAGALLSGGVSAQQAVRPTVAGKLVSLNTATGMAELRMENGKIWRIKLTKAHYEVQGKNTSSSAFQPGMQVAFRIVGSMAESPLQSDLLMDWGSSSKYVATAAPAPYFTQKGEYATTNGVGGASEGAPAGQRPDKTIGILGNGGKLQGDPTMQGANGANQTLSPGQRQAAAYNLNSGVDPAGMPGTSLMNGDDDQPTGGPPGISAGGAQVQFQAVIMESAPGGRSMRVQANGQMQNVLLPANINPATLRVGQTVFITGTANNGVIEASSVMAAGGPPGPGPTP